MVDFAKRILDDFMCGRVLFVGEKGDAETVSRKMYEISVTGKEEPAPDGEIPVVCRKHGIASLYLIGYADAYKDWVEQKMEELAPHGDDPEYDNTYVIPWATITELICNLNCKSLDEILRSFTDYDRSKDTTRIAINVNDMGCDVVDALAAMSKHCTDARIGVYDLGWHPADIDVLEEYIDDAKDDGYTIIFQYRTNGDGERELDALRNASLTDELVYPIAYLQEKAASCPPTFSESDFSDVFD